MNISSRARSWQPLGDVTISGSDSHVTEVSIESCGWFCHNKMHKPVLKRFRNEELMLEGAPLMKKRLQFFGRNIIRALSDAAAVIKYPLSAAIEVPI
jgi:hypothetical protein